MSGDERDPIFSQALDPSRCFLCGEMVEEVERTKEHIFPSWMQSDFGLWDKSLTLLNGTVIPYRQVTVTCCFKCNNKYLKPLEDKVSTAFREGAGAVRALDPEVLFLWLAKIYYGLLFRELTLRLDRTNPDNESTITNPEILRAFGVHHVLMRRVLGEVSWNLFPASIFVFDALTSETSAVNFDYFDAIDQPFLTLRCGSSYVVAFLQDFGAAHDFGVDGFEEVRAAYRLVLHPFQCIELDALFLTVLKQHHPAGLMLGQVPHGWDVMVSPRGGLSDLPPYDPWDRDYCRKILEGMWKMRAGSAFVATEVGVPSFLFDGNGDPFQAPNFDWMPPTESRRVLR
jgi:hypothetical protein